MSELKKVNVPAAQDYEYKYQDPRILCFDIETAACTGRFWSRPWETSIVRIVSDWSLISWSAKWLYGKQTTKALCDYPGYKPGNMDDRALVKDLYDLIEQADIIVAHNGDRFDVTRSNARFIVHGFDPIRKKSVDTKKLAKKYFGFTSNKLDDIARLFNLGTKIPIHYEIWEGCEAGDAKAWAKMKKYNAHDTRLLERVYLKFRPWDAGHPNLNVIAGRDTQGCPSCGSTDYQKRGFNYTTTGRRPEFKCKSCGRRYTGKHQKISEFR